MAGDGECLLELSQSPEFRAGARVTLIFVIVFAISILGQLYAKITAIQAYKKSKRQTTEESAVHTPINDGGNSNKTYSEETSTVASPAIADNQTTRPRKFNRYTSDNLTLLVSDRIIGNYIEWSVPFLSVFWLSILLTGKGEILGHAYSAFRLLYIVLAFNGGIKAFGNTPIIYPATLPMYLILILLTKNASQVAFF